jgi:hypothetical protein
MQTFSVIGSDKNAGKTTTLNHIRRQWQKEGKKFCTTSIGINGEGTDNYEGTEKPFIHFSPGEFFVTAARHCQSQSGKYRVTTVFSPPLFSQEFILGKCEIPCCLILEGPNEKQQISELKKELQKIIPQGRLLIDGSIDRQFIAHPDISDAFFFALLAADRKEQNAKADDLLFALNIPLCSPEHKSIIQKNDPDEKLRFCLFNNELEAVLKSDTPAFACSELKQHCLKNPRSPLLLYLNGALSPSLCHFLRPFESLKIVLHNFTLYQGVSTQKNAFSFLRHRLRVLHPLVVEKIFLQAQGQKGSITDLPEGIPVCNLFRD